MNDQFIQQVTKIFIEKKCHVQTNPKRIKNKINDMLNSV